MVESQCCQNFVQVLMLECQDLGQISWKIKLTDSIKLIETVILHFNSTTYENGAVTVEICSDNKVILLGNGETEKKFNDFYGSNSLTVKATLSGGKGDVAWQHAQLFRQSTDSTDFPFSLTIIFK